MGRDLVAAVVAAWTPEPQYDLTPRGWRTLLAIALHVRDDKAELYAGQRTIAEWAGMGHLSRPQQHVHDRLRELVDAGVLVLIEAGAGRRPARYRLAVAPPTSGAQSDSVAPPTSGAQDRNGGPVVPPVSDRSAPDLVDVAPPKPGAKEPHRNPEDPHHQAEAETEYFEEALAEVLAEVATGTTATNTPEALARYRARQPHHQTRYAAARAAAEEAEAIRRCRLCDDDGWRLLEPDAGTHFRVTTDDGWVRCGHQPMSTTVELSASGTEAPVEVTL